MPPFKPPSLLLVPEDKEDAPGPSNAPSAAAAKQRGVRDSWEVKADGHVAMLGKSLRGDYVFSGRDGGSLIKAGGSEAPFYKVCEADVLFIKVLGSGACATVHKGYHRSLRKFVAVKRVSAANREQRQQMLRDIRILSDAQAVPGLLAFLGAYLVPGREQMAVVLEYMDGGTLADVLKKLGRVPEDVMAQLTAKVLQGLAFMHAKHMVHRDIKPANILLSLNGDAKLSDFGISATVDHTHALCHTYAGTVTYMSPERLENKPYNFTADIWSLGLVLLECLMGAYPFDASGGPMQLIIHVLQDEPPLPPHGAVSELCRDFLSQCLAREPGRRPPATALLSHPWIARAAAADVKGLLKRTMFSAEDRLEEIALHFAFTFHSLLGQLDGLSQLGALYLDHSVLTHQGVAVTGRGPILAKLQELAALQAHHQQQLDRQRAADQQPQQPRQAWQLDQVDCQPLLQTGCVVLHITGRAPLPGGGGCGGGGCGAAGGGGGGGGPGVPFAESVILARTAAGEYYVANQAVRLLA